LGFGISISVWFGLQGYFSPSISPHLLLVILYFLINRVDYYLKSEGSGSRLLRGKMEKNVNHFIGCIGRAFVRRDWVSAGLICLQIGKRLSLNKEEAVKSMEKQNKRPKG
jgi:hypothetical protein